MEKVLFQKYEILRILGVGGSGEVALARDLHLNRLVAVKKTTDCSAITELELLREMKHQGLPEIYDFFSEQGSLYLIMEYVEGISMKQYLEKNGPVSVEQTVEWALQLIQILKYLHAHRPPVIYRDLKPANIMIRPDGEIKLIDLGAAFRNHYGQKKGKETEGLRGTPGYCPMEQWKGNTAGKTCDIYGLGAVLHEMLTGVNPSKPPYERRPVREYDRSIPTGLEKIIKICTASKATDRYQSMEQLERAMKNYRHIGRSEKIIYTIKKTLVGFPIILGASYIFLPLLQGIPETAFPRPFLEKPILCFAIALLLQVFFFERTRKKNCLKKHEKSIWLTEKQFTGLFLLLLLLLSGMEMGAVSYLFPGTAYAGAVEKKLWVEMRGEDNRKLLLKDNAVYRAQDRIKLEIPTGDLPVGELAIQLVAIGRNGEIYTSRIFNIAAGPEQQE